MMFIINILLALCKWKLKLGDEQRDNGICKQKESLRGDINIRQGRI